MVDLCKPVSDIASRQHLRSANSHQLYVQCYRRSMFGCRAFSVAGPTAWHTLPDDLRDPALLPHTFRVGLKTLLFSSYKRIRGLTATMRYTNLTLTLTLTLTLLYQLYLLTCKCVTPMTTEVSSKAHARPILTVLETLLEHKLRYNPKIFSST